MTFLLQQVNNLLALPMFARHSSYSGRPFSEDNFIIY
jgi:hypothetical protein